MFSVIIPVYNSEKTILKTLESVLYQTRLDLIEEIIIINDGSTDKTVELIKQFIKDNPEINFILLNQENKGVSSARNLGIYEAKGKWIALLDSDDIWLFDKIQKQYSIITKNKNVYFLGCEHFDNNSKELIKLNAKQLCIRSTPVTPSVIFEKNKGIELGLFNENMNYAEDINFFQKFLKIDSYYILNENLVKINIEKNFHGESGLSSKLLKMNNGRNKNVDELYFMGLISNRFRFLMKLLNYIKLLRRIFITQAYKMLFKIKKGRLS